MARAATAEAAIKFRRERWIGGKSDDAGFSKNVLLKN
jgi:hypothetical protein